MPGFALAGDSQGKLPNAQAEPRFKHRWVFEVADGPDTDIFLYLREASRPKVNQDAVEMWHNQAPAYFSGRSQWNPISITFYDIEQNPDVSDAVWNWHQMVVEHSSSDSATAKRVKNYKKKGKLDSLGADGTSNETWELYNCWPQDIDFSNLSYTTSEVQVITVSLKYDAAIRLKGK